MIITIPSARGRQIIDITDEVGKHVSADCQAVQLFVLHTTAALTTADLDPGTDEDLLDALLGMLPQKQWRHPHNPDHAPAHLLSSIIGPSVTVPVGQGKLLLGSWQRIILIELDGPRERSVAVTLLK